jgi:signal peptidase I
MPDAAEPARPVRSHSSKPFFREICDALLVALVFAVFARTWVVQAFKIPSGSMEDNLQVGDHILVNKFVYGPVRFAWEDVLLPSRPVRRGDVAVFKFPEDPKQDFIKRCVALPGDEVELVDKELHLDGEPVAEAGYVHFADPVTYPESPGVTEYYRIRDQFGPYEVPEGRYFCLGDNRDRSQDSRYWGPVPRSHLKGRALLIYWSVAGAGEAPGAAAAGRGPWWRRPGRELRRVAAATRWDRSLTLVR